MQFLFPQTKKEKVAQKWTSLLAKTTGICRSMTVMYAYHLESFQLLCRLWALHKSCFALMIRSIVRLLAFCRGTPWFGFSFLGLKRIKLDQTSGLGERSRLGPLRESEVMWRHAPKRWLHSNKRQYIVTSKTVLQHLLSNRSISQQFEVWTWILRIWRFCHAFFSTSFSSSPWSKAIHWSLNPHYSRLPPMEDGPLSWTCNLFLSKNCLSWLSGPAKNESWSTLWETGNERIWQQVPRMARSSHTLTSGQKMHAA